MKTTNELEKLINELNKLNSQSPIELDQLKEAAETVGKSWCGSWLGYQSCIYYDSFISIPAGAHFDVLWGNVASYGNQTHGRWLEYDFDCVVDHIYSLAGVDNIEKVEKECEKIERELDKSKNSAKSILSIFNRKSNDDFVKEQLQKLQDLKIHTATDFIKILTPKSICSRDSLAMGQGCRNPPHYVVISRVASLKEHYIVLKDFINTLLQIKAHIDRIKDDFISTNTAGDKIFIGHGGSLLWLKLKDFIKDKLELPYEEFNRITVAGVANTERLQSMLDNARFAFLVMTAEDDQKDGTTRARMNVIHELGLFQGRLGISRAIILLEENCEGFSNIDGLGHIKFPKGDIEACFEKIRDVLLHHEIIQK